MKRNTTISSISCAILWKLSPQDTRSKPLDEQQRRVLPVDSAGSKIDDNYIEYYLEDMLFEEIDLDDVLVSILVTIAPRRIVIHENNPLPSKESVTMIRNVFQDRIVTCQGCERCGQLKGHEAGLRRP